MKNALCHRGHSRVLAILLLAVVSALFSGCKYEGNIQMDTSYGTLLGNRDDQVTRFLGIPFAAPPVGELRWADPQPPAAWDGVRDATWFGHACNQTIPLLPVRSPGREDCLTLNVWAPNTPGPHPVIQQRFRSRWVQVWRASDWRALPAQQLPLQAAARQLRSQPR